MTEDDKTGISHLIEKELTSSDKILKPDFNQKTGRELLAFYLQSKFKQVLAYDNKAAEPIFVEVRYDFIQKFSRRLIQNPNKRIMIGIFDTILLNLFQQQFRRYLLFFVFYSLSRFFSNFL